MNRVRRESFQEYLCRRLGVSMDSISWPNRWSGAGNTIGGIALRSGLLELQDLERILDQQSARRKLFGQIAVELGLLTGATVDRLLELQRLHLHLEQGESAVLQGKVEVNAMLDLLREFLAEQSASAGKGSEPLRR